MNESIESAETTWHLLWYHYPQSARSTVSSLAFPYKCSLITHTWNRALLGFIQKSTSSSVAKAKTQQLVAPFSYCILSTPIQDLVILFSYISECFITVTHVVKIDTVNFSMRYHKLIQTVVAFRNRYSSADLSQPLKNMFSAL